MKNNSMRNISIILLLIYIVMQLLIIAPNSRVGQIVFLLWFICTYSAYKPIVSSVLSNKMMWLLYVFLLYYGLSMLYSHSIVYSISAVLSTFEMFSPFLMYRIIKEEKIRTRRLVVTIISLVFVVNVLMCYNYVTHSITGYGMRDIEITTGFKNTFWVLYSIAILVPLLVYYLSHTVSSVKRFLGLRIQVIGYVLCVILAYFVIKSQFMTAMLLMVIGALVAFFYKRRGAVIVIPIVAILSVSMFLFFVGDLIKMAENNGAMAISVRLEEVQHILSRNASNAADFSYRQNLSKTSFQTFIENPIFGTVYKYESIDEAKLLNIGNHAEWMDLLAKYGLFSVFLMAFLIKAVVKQRKIAIANIHYILFFVLGFLNPLLSFYMTLAVFFYMPLIGDVYFSE